MKICLGSPGSLPDTGKILEAVGDDITEIYLSVKLTEFGSGRDNIYDLSLEELTEIVRLALPYKVTISLAFNALCFNGRQYSSHFLKRYAGLLEELRRAGINHLIISDAFLIDWTLSNYRGFHITVSSISLVDSVEKARLYEEMGVHRIIFPIDGVRKFKLLSEVRKSLKCELEIMANLACLYTCPHHSFHSQYHSHSSRGEVGGMVDDDDPYKAFCTRLMKREPWRLLSGAWIRPEDLDIYEEMGIDYLKLAGRELGADWIIRSARAYIDRCYRENLLDIFSTPFGISEEVYLDNERLETAFTEQTINCHKRCTDSSCGSGEPLMNNCRRWQRLATRLRQVEL